MRTRSRLPSAEELRRLADTFEDAFARSVDEATEWLGTPQGRRFRAFVAGALVLATPMLLRHPFFKTPFGKVVELAGVAAALTKAADLIREWEPAPTFQR
jgi:hypothetical protein